MFRNGVAAWKLVACALVSTGLAVAVATTPAAANTPNAPAFCVVLPQVAAVQAEFQALAGNIDPTSQTTITNTQPSVGDVTAFVGDVAAVVTPGDLNVTDDIKPQWDVVSGGLSQLSQTLQTAGYQFSTLPPLQVQAIVDAANASELPGVLPADLDAAKAALTTWSTTNCVGAPTPPGTTVPVQPVDPATGTSPVTVTFATVGAAGLTAVTSSSSGPAVPTGFQLGNPPTYYDVTTTAGYSGAITLCFSYDPVAYPAGASLVLYHFDSVTNAWQNVTTSVTTAPPVICGTTTSLSPFTVLAAPPPPGCKKGGGQNGTDRHGPDPKNPGRVGSGNTGGRKSGRR